MDNTLVKIYKLSLMSFEIFSEYKFLKNNLECTLENFFLMSFGCFENFLKCRFRKYS